MQIILSNQCESLTGNLGSGFGYAIQRRKNGFFAKRNSKGNIPSDGHLRFIFACAQLAQNKLHIADVRVSREEVKYALYEAHCFIAMQNLRKDFYNASDILNLKTTFGL